MNHFAGTADYYAQHRPGIPAQVVEALDAATPSPQPRRLLDIGTGPGLVVQALADRFDDIIAVDADTDMLAAAQRALRPPTVPPTVQLMLLHGQAETVTLPRGWQADLVTFSRVFHWLDKPRVLSHLEQHVTAYGALAVLSDRSLWTADAPWQQAVRRTVQDFLGEQRRAGDSVFQPSGTSYADVLSTSAFNKIAQAQIPVRRTWTTESVLGYLYSTSFAAPHLFGQRRGAFEDAVRTVLARFCDADGLLVEDNAFTVLIAHRPTRPRRPEW